MNKEKKKLDFKNLTKKQKVLIIVAVTVLIAVIALSVSLPLALRNKGIKTASPVFAAFDQRSDVNIVAEWKSVKGASNYSIEYCYGVRNETNITKITTTATNVSVARQKGVLSLRVRANLKNGGVFSEWITKDIAALKLSSPTVSISNSFNVTWTDVYYSYQGTRYPVSVYSLDIAVDGAYASLGAQFTENHFDYLVPYVKRSIESFYEEGLTEWEDVTVTVRVKATNEPMFSADTKENYLFNAYESGDFGYAEIIITKEIYERL